MKFNDGKTIKIFYTGENFYPDFTESHAAFTFVEIMTIEITDYLYGHYILIGLMLDIKK